MTEKKQLNWVIKNLLYGLVFILLIIIIVNVFLRVTTQHSITVEVPDMVGITLPQAQAIAEKDNLELIVTDSVFVNRVGKGCVYAQNPKAGNKVKRGRKIYLTVNAKKEKQTIMPDLVGLSLRQARVELNTRGLKLGRLIYVDDMATNIVLVPLIKGEEAQSGASIDVGTTVDLKLGLNQADAYITMPDFTGMQYMRAVSSVQENSFNLDRVVFDATVKTEADSLNAFVYHQVPTFETPDVILGSRVTLYLTLDEKRLPVREEEPTEEEIEQSSF